MTLRSTLMLASAMLVGVASQAQAATGSFPLNNVPNQVTTNAIFGGGASLPAPYLRQAADCYADKIDLAFRANNVTQAVADFANTALPADCSTAASQVSPVGTAVSYISTGSGRGILGWFAHTPFYQDPAGKTGDSWLGTTAGPNAPAVYGTKVNFGASEAGLPRTATDGSGDIDVYEGNKVDVNGASVGATVTQSGVTIRINSKTGVTAPGTPTGTNVDFPNPLVSYGRPIQIPLLIAVPAIAFDPIYRKTADANGVITNDVFTRATKSGNVKLSNTQFCNIFNGYDTNFGQDGLAAVFGLQSKDTATAGSIPLQIVGRSDGSGTTSIFYRHVERICDNFLAGKANRYKVDSNTADRNGVLGVNAPTTLPTALRGPAYTKGQTQSVPPTGETPGLFTRADGNDGVAEYLDFSRIPAPGTAIVQARIGYVGNDYVLPYVRTQQNTYLLQSAALQNAAGAYVAATPSAALKAFGTTAAPVLLPPQTDGAGKFSSTRPGARSDAATRPDVYAFPVNGAGVSADPTTVTTTGTTTYTTSYTWVSGANIASPLADPTTTGAYPLVGTTNGLFYQCYADASERTIVRGFLTWFYTNKTSNDPSKGILALNGLAPVTKAYQTAINETFVTNPSYTTVGRLNLDIQAGGSGVQCAGVAGA